MYTEIKYLHLLSPRLDKFKQKKNNLWNFRCPLCGDSQKNKNKARGFVFEVKGDLVFKCHNCQMSLPFVKFLEQMDPGLLKEYKLEKFKDSGKKKPDMRKVKKIVSTTPVFKVDNLSSLTPISSLNTSHEARSYLENRKLPIEALFYTEKFKEWTNSIRPGTFEEVTNDEPRIVIPFRDFEGNVFAYQGRSLSVHSIRYITIILDETQPKIFGLDRVNRNETVYVVEGPFDSLLLPNSIAMAGADVHIPSDWFSDVVYVFDNEPRNAQITQRISHSIQSGDKVVIWPKTTQEKDINDMILSGQDPLSMIQSNTYSGLSAKLQFETWRK